MISLYVFATYGGHRSCRKIAEFLEDKSKACEYVAPNKLPKKPKLLNLKFMKFTVKFGVKFDLVDFKIISIDSTPIEAYVNEYRCMSIEQITYLEDLIIDLSMNKSKRPVWNKIRRYFYNGELPNDMIELIDEIYHNLNKSGRELLQVALCSKKSRDMILGVIDELKDNYDGKHYVSLTDPESRKMHMKDGTTRYAYLLQTVKDVKNRINHNAAISSG